MAGKPVLNPGEFGVYYRVESSKRPKDIYISNVFHSLEEAKDYVDNKMSIRKGWVVSIVDSNYITQYARCC